MEIDNIGNDIWDRLAQGERLTQEQESLVMTHIKFGDFKDVPSIVTQLRANSRYLQEKSIDEIAKVVDNLNMFYITQASTHLEDAVKTEWQGSFTNAQANRLENTAAQELAKQQKAAEEARRQKAAAQEMARQQAAALQAAQAARVLPPPPPPVGHAAAQGALTARNPPPTFKGSLGSYPIR